MKNIFFERHQFIANYLAKFPDAYQKLGLGNQTNTHKLIAVKLNVTESSFRMLRDEYDGFYDNRKGFPHPYKRKSRVEYKTKFENIQLEDYVSMIHQILQNYDIINFDQYNDDNIATDSFIEGKGIKITINKYERSLDAKNKCIEFYGRKCTVCGFEDFNIFGDNIKIVEVHHLVPISQISENYKVNPVKDLRPLCPNCHRAIHNRKPPYSIEDLKKIISRG